MSKLLKTVVNSKEETIFPHRFSHIRKVSDMKSFSGSDGVEIFGTEVTMENGDSFGVWSSDRDEVELFSSGRKLLYQLKKISDNGKEKVRLESFQFMLPRGVRAETDIVKNVNSAVYTASRIAAEILGEGYTKAKFKKIADEVYDWMKDKLLNENYGE